MAVEAGIFDRLFPDILVEEELNAYVTCIHHCLLEAVDELMRSLGQDPSKIDRKSRINKSGRWQKLENLIGVRIFTLSALLELESQSF